jgi:acyl-coenzyme A thioesterase 9
MMHLNTAIMMKLMSSAGSRGGSRQVLHELIKRHASKTVAGHYTPITKKLWDERLNANTSSDDSSAKERPPSHSLVQLSYPFSTDEMLRQTYKNPWNRIRIGCILEDLDSLAGSVAFRHSHQSGQPVPLLVTAAVDEIQAKASINIDTDVSITGSVVWTGRSALDIRMALHQDGVGKMEALFSFVHLDPKTMKASPVIQLRPTNDQEVKLAAEREKVANERKAARRAAEEASKAGIAMSHEAKTWMASALNEAKARYELPSLSSSDEVFISATSLSNTFIAQAQQQNTRGRIFGGFLMRRAYELAFASAYTFCGGRPSFIKVDEVSFKLPVEIGDLCRFRSRVLHTTPEGVMWIEVDCLVCKPEKQTIANTNTFLFVFQSQPQDGKTLKRVIPATEEEALRSWQCRSSSA